MERAEDQSNLDNPTPTTVGDNQGALLFAVDEVAVDDVAVEEVAMEGVSVEASPSRPAVERRSTPWLEDAESWPVLVEDEQGVSADGATDEPGSPQAPELGTTSLFGREADEQVDGGAEGESVETVLSPDSGLVRYPNHRAETTGTNVDAIEDNGRSCRVCSSPVAQISIKVDGNILILESCDYCDTRRWRLDGQPIDLQQALAEVGERTGRHQ